MRVGIIGTGFSANAHVDALKRLPYVEVVAVQSKTLSRAEHFANTHNIAYAFTDPYELIAHDEIDAIHNCTSNHMHYPINEYALEQRKCIISEKPLGISTSESQKLVDLAQEMKCANAVCFNYRFYL
ncbi:Gfo/Idh/MocA family protein [Geomicrobium sp. JCM 19039]|uniref:Gfo/Idh/MocA family protein n=1 Tax=Geomicrobium sp. JCM 19039 TaxID=1460636 RepID=UPI0006950135|nr:Gfo/Idh/MocA family oxidoreductase [Geomicrobium sp. JCM 19039]